MTNQSNRKQTNKNKTFSSLCVINQLKYVINSDKNPNKEPYSPLFIILNFIQFLITIFSVKKKNIHIFI